MPTDKGRIDTRSLGLDLATRFAKFLTGSENLHYGYWQDGQTVCAANLGAAQDAYTQKLLSMFPAGRHRILDIGGGAGETARKLAALGHEVEIVVPSEFLAERCRAVAGSGVPVHRMTFEDFRANGRFDLCLFSESFQYVDLETAFERAADCLRSGGWMLIADCFRDEDAVMQAHGGYGVVGGGHGLRRFRSALDVQPLVVECEEDVTDRVAPSIDLEQEFYQLIGHALRRVDGEVERIYPQRRRALLAMLRTLLSERRRRKIMHRLDGQSRNSANFRRCNHYLMIRLRKP